MYTAKIINKERNADDNLVVTVEFSEGTHKVNESVIPQDERGFKHWVKSRIESLDSSKALEDADNVDQVVDTTEPTPVVTPEEAEWLDWKERYNRYWVIHNTMIKTGILTGDEPQVVNYVAALRSDWKWSYVDRM